MLESPGYKIVEVKIEPQFLKSMEDIVNSINHLFSQEEFYLTVQNSSIIIHLNMVDIEKLRNIALRVAPEKETVSDHPLNQVIEAIESIGSYGMKSGKRSFVTYNKERKVQVGMNYFLF